MNHKTLQQFYQHLKAEQLDRMILQATVLQLQNDFALLRYLLFSSVGTIPFIDFSLIISATSPSISPNPNPNPTSNALLNPRAAEPSVRRSTPEDAVAPRRTKANNSANVDFHFSTTTLDKPLTMVQNLSSRSSRREKLLAAKIATFTSITAWIHSQDFFYMIKFARLRLVIRMLSCERFPQ